MTGETLSDSSARPDELPIAVSPIHDPQGWMPEHRRAMAPQLKALFSRAVVSVSARTEVGIDELLADPFFDVVRNPDGIGAGEQFLNGYRRAVELCPGEQRLHLPFEQRLAYALESEHRAAFLADLELANDARRPVLFQRSARAWLTHRQTFYAVESMATRVGEILLGRSLDFAWCYLAVRAGRLKVKSGCTLGGACGEAAPGRASFASVKASGALHPHAV